MEKYYTVERNVQIVIALLKAHGIRKVIASPGTTNMTFVGSIQQDPYFQIWSSVDERSAAYMACGMAAETGEPIVLSCTGATASRNYMPGLTEAFYRKLPILAITSHRGAYFIGHLFDQQIDRRSIPNDVAMCSVTIPMVRTAQDERFCELETNKAILALHQYGGGPVHINLYTEYNRDFSVKVLPPANAIYRYSPFDKLPDLPQKGKIGVLVGAHSNFTKEETFAIDRFCASHNAVVFCDHTSGYTGRYKVYFHLLCCQKQYCSPCAQLDLMIHIGEVSGTYHVNAREVWRVSEDGALRDTYGALTRVFAMPEVVFFKHYSLDGVEHSEFLCQCKDEYRKAIAQIPELPFGNAWIAQCTLPHMPAGCEIHMGIYNSLRSWSFFEWPENVLGKCNVGGFGIDGALSTMIGASLNNKEKLYYCILGDLAFFYDMNVVGNRHVGNNVRIMLINNSRGSEFRLYGHPCSEFGDDADPYMAAAGHYGHQSPTLVRDYAESLGYEYLTARNKDEYLKIMDRFVIPYMTDRPMVLEVFTETEDESKALELIQNACYDASQVAMRKIKNTLHSVIGNTGIKIIKSIVGR